MELKNLIHYFCLSLFLVTGSLFVTSCNIFDEDLPECRLYVKFKYDYNMLFTDAFHTQVDKVELYVFDKEGKFLFMQSEEGDGQLPDGSEVARWTVSVSCMGGCTRVVRRHYTQKWL